MTDKVDIYVDKEITAIGLPPVARTYVKEKLTFRNPEYEEILKRAKEEEKAERLAVTPEYLYFFEEDTSDNILAIPLGFYEDLLNLLNTLQITYIIHPLYEEKRVTFPPHSISLRPYQVVPVKNSVVEFKNNPSFMFLSKAGSGKTTCALWIAHAMGQKTLWLTDLGILYDQVIERIITFLNIPREDIGEIKPGVIKIGKHITVGMIPTIYNFDDVTIQRIEKEFGLIIVDEVVSIPTKRFFGVISRLSSPYKLGLTALAHREDGLTEAIYRIIGNPKIQPKPGGIVYPKIIRRPTGCKYYVRPDLLTKYKFILDRKIISDKKRNKLIVDDIAMYHDKFITIVLTRSVEHMEELRNSLKAVHNVDSCMIHSKQNDKLNAVQKQAFESNEKNIMFATYNMLKKGYDYPRVDRLIFAFPVSSREWIVQTVGRATREAPGKKGAIVLDYVDEAEMLTAQANIREKVYKEEGLHVVTKTEKEYLDDSDKSRLFDENDNKR